DKNDGRIVWQALDDTLSYSSPIWVEFDGAAQLLFFTGEGAVALSPQDGRVFWRHGQRSEQDEFGLHAATPLYAGGRVFLSSNRTGGTLLRLKKGGAPEVVWAKKTMQNHFGTSVLYDGHVYGFSGSRLRCLDLATGTPQWDQTGLGKGTLLVADS